ncbi:hypothetical protein HPB47_005948 [Ixodes persulcatus]|uniref:Uncharacterized protein n=1 Tax=Ixodes persulcatus TaxID=34615 RepID=A0AC60PC65_IXOPE|nr:hypothetical protein HPB47_005948 [Ixodes persulcatus]
MSPMISRKLVRVIIDEEGAVSVGSDHNRILAIFGGPRTTGAIRNLPRERALRENEIEEIARKLEKVANRDMTYESIVNCISIEIKKMKIGKGMSTKRELKSWWHPEIRQAINIRQEACRRHRAARERKVKEELWEKYRETKLKCKQVVQRRRRAVNHLPDALGFRTAERGDDGEEHVETTKRRLEQWWEISWRLWKRERRAGPDGQAQAEQPIFSTQVDLPHTVDPTEVPTEQELG